MNTLLTNALAALIKKYGAKTQLFTLPETEFETTDTLIGAVICAAGHDERPRAVVNARNWWGISTSEFAEVLQSDVANQSGAYNTQP